MKAHSEGYFIYNEMNRDYHLETDEQFEFAPDISVRVARRKLLPVTVEGAKSLSKLRYFKENDFLPVFNATLTSLQNMDFRGGEFYLQEFKASNEYSFWGFSEKPRRTIIMNFVQKMDYSLVQLCVAPTLWLRKGRRAHAKPIPEGVFMEARRLLFEYLHDRSAYKLYQEKLFSQVEALVGTPDGAAVPTAVLNQDYYFTQAKERMMKRKEEILSRLVDLDDEPERRRELRSEMKGIEYCIAVLEGRHQDG